MGNDDTHSRERLSLSRRRALAVLGAGTTTAIAGCNSPSEGQRATETPAETPRNGTPDGQSEVSGSNQGHSIKEVLPGEKFGSTRIGEFDHTLRFSGTRESAWMVRPFQQDIEPQSNSYQEAGDGVHYGNLPFPPGKVPVLRLNCRIEADDGVETGLRVSIANRPAVSTPDGVLPLEEGPVRKTLMEASAIGSAQMYDEVYLTEVKNVVMGMDNGHRLPSHTFLFEARTDSPGNTTISRSSTIALEMEAL